MTHTQGAARPGKRGKTDLLFRDEGTVILITPLNNRARCWVQDHVFAESWQYLGPSIACEPRYAALVLEAMGDEGFIIGNALAQ